MTRTSIVIVILWASTFAGCKGDPVVRDNPQTLTDLDNCKKNLDEKDKLVKAEEAENATLMRGSATAGEIVVTIEGNALTVKPAGPGEPAHPIDDKAAATESREFLDLVAKSRGAIQKCYQLALKKRSDLQARTVTLTVSASFAQSGSYHDASFSPSLGDPFDQCIKTVASKWAMPTASPAMTFFKAQVSLTPS